MFDSHQHSSSIDTTQSAKNINRLQTAAWNAFNFLCRTVKLATELLLLSEYSCIKQTIYERKQTESDLCVVCSRNENTHSLTKRECERKEMQHKKYVYEYQMKARKTHLPFFHVIFIFIFQSYNIERISLPMPRHSLRPFHIFLQFSSFLSSSFRHHLQKQKPLNGN